MANIFLKHYETAREAEASVADGDQGARSGRDDAPIAGLDDPTVAAADADPDEGSIGGGDGGIDFDEPFQGGIGVVDEPNANDGSDAGDRSDMRDGTDADGGTDGDDGTDTDEGGDADVEEVGPDDWEFEPVEPTEEEG